MASQTINIEIASRTSRLVRAFFDAVGTVEAHQARRRTRRALERLTTEQLQDIGLTRADIYRRF